ncbi:MAG: hypothetical protein ACXVXZ_13070 [Mycobacteriaceae bacterium]
MNATLVLGELVLCLAFLWTFVLVIRPGVARARLGLDATRIRDRIVDAILEGQIERTDQAALDALLFCHQMTDHAREFGVSEGFATMRALARLDVEPRELETSETKVTYANMSPEGRKVMIEATRAIDDIMARYLVQGSMAWWLLCPAQWLWRRLRGGKPRPVTTPHELAQEVRRAARERSEEHVSRRNLSDSLQDIARAHGHRVHAH